MLPILCRQGKHYGESSKTVVTDAKYMSNDWKEVKSREVSGKTVLDYVIACGKSYNVFTDNCHLGRRRMMKLQ